LSEICIHHPHSLGVERAREIIDALLLKLHERHPHALHEVRWNRERTAATVAGRGVSGSFEIGAAHLAVHLKLGLLVRPLKQKAEARIREKLQEHFS
jgi:putative polyhydroxyalkanoate system protein